MISDFRVCPKARASLGRIIGGVSGTRAVLEEEVCVYIGFGDFPTVLLFSLLRDSHILSHSLNRPCSLIFKGSPQNSLSLVIAGYCP
jgi:hypothetical protein